MTDYESLTAQLRALAGAEPWYVPLLANASALLMEALPSLNWAGFYLLRGEELVLGPFQGRVACVRIAPGRGVCGTALRKDETQLVPDVHAFPGHIACDAASNAELVVPIHAHGAVAAVLDLDSPVKGRFTEEDRAGLEAFVRALEEVIRFD